VSERGQASSFARTSNSNAKYSERQSLPAEVKGVCDLSVDEYVLLQASRHDAKPLRSTRKAYHESESTVPTEVVDEAALIEKRRKRREALKAKFGNPETPIAMQEQRPATGLESPRRSSSHAPGIDKSAESIVGELAPATSSSNGISVSDLRKPDGLVAEVDSSQIDKPSHLHVASTAADEEECSAADYDPTIDMQDERARHDKRLFNEDVSMSAGQEQAILEQGKLSIVEHGSETAKTGKDAFDMFAEDDDEVDMFADPRLRSSKPSSAIDAKTAQSLDVKMMDNWDDAQGYYVTIPGELFESRYHVLQNLGRGMFSSVVRATDTKTNKLVAIKIVRNNDTMRKAGLKEIEILKDLAENDADDKKHVIRLERSFEHKGHLCMVFENLSLNLREVLKKFGRDVGINVKAIRAYAQQLFLGLSHMRKCQYLHADLKPDNILVNEARSVLKICDLGSASSIDENVTAPYLVSRFYRAPEIILGIPYDYGIDVWSVGCTLFEMYTGKILFTGRNNNAMLRSIMECRGKFPHKVLRRGSLSYQYFDDLLNFRAIEEDKLSGRTVTKMIDVKAKPVRSLRERLVPKDRRLWDEQERKEVELFTDLLDKCLDLRGDKRITPADALRHPFIARGKA
jgi:serine/threonine-protein kinase PRP4